VVEAQLCAAMPPDQWQLTSDSLILHGRRICRPFPLCPQCAVVDLCDFAADLRRKGGRAKARVDGPPAPAAPRLVKRVPRSVAEAVTPATGAKPVKTAKAAPAAKAVKPGSASRTGNAAKTGSAPKTGNAAKTAGPLNVGARSATPGRGRASRRSAK
jgi:endonuclease-3